MEEEPVMAAPDIDKLQEEQQNFIIERESEAEQNGSVCGDSVATDDVQSAAVSQQQAAFDDELTLDDITATPREKTREEIIAEAEAAAFAEAEEA
jgi:ribonuclease-3